MDTQDYLTAINATGVNSLPVAWQSEVKPAAAYKAHTLIKQSSAVVMTGVEFANLAVNSDRETGELPWGTWLDYPFVVTHKGQDYARLYTVDGTVKTTYYVDGFDVTRDEFNAYLTPSAAAAKRPVGGTITVKMSGLRMVGAAVAA